MINIKQKISDGINRIKRKCKSYLGWLLGITATVVLAATLYSPTELPPPPIVDPDTGQMIEFNYTDENANENLPTWTDKKEYGGWDYVDVYSAIKNTSGKNQFINSSFLSGTEFSVYRVEQLVKDVAYQKEVNDFDIEYYDCSYIFNGSTTPQLISKTCERTIKIGTHFETRYRDEWQVISLDNFNKSQNQTFLKQGKLALKDRKGLKADKKFSYSLDKNEIIYLKVRMEIPRKSKGEFIIESFGSNGGFGSCDPWYNSNYTYRREISIDPSKIDDDLTNFPVLVTWASSTIPTTKYRDDGYDIIFTDSDGDTLIDFEREMHSSSTGYFYHTEVPSVSSSTSATTTIYMYYGNAAASDLSSSTAPWDANFVGVWHMNESAGSCLDSTGINDGTFAGSLPTPIDGKIGKCQDLDGTGDWASRTDDATLDMGTGNHTLEGWIKATSGSMMFFLGKSNAAYTLLYWLYLASDGDIVYTLDGDVGGSAARITTSGTYGDNAWHYITGVRLGDTSEVRVDYDTESVSGTAAVGNIDNDGSLVLGNLTTTYGSPFTGEMDEFRISKGIARSDAWLKGTYNSGINSLLTFGAEEEEAAERRIFFTE